MRLPPEGERLLLDVVADGFTVYCCGPLSAPIALAACYEWGEWLDHIIIRHWDHAVAARLPKRGRVDPFAPELVVWSYEGPAEPTLRALLALIHPSHPHAPRTCYPAPRALHVPRHQQRPMRIRVPAPNWAGARAARLARVWGVEPDRSVSHLATKR
jgi:hypothetical protein